MAAITLVDSTLRDGSHAKRHQLSVEQVTTVAAALDRAGVDVIEVSHGDGLGGASFNYGFALTDEFELIAAAVGAVERARIAVLLLPGIGVKEDLARARELGASVTRVATHSTEADISPSHLAFARELGYKTCGFLMMAHMNSPEGLLEQAKIMEAAGAETVYVTDSAGALMPDTVKVRVEALRGGLEAGTEVGFHGHENLSLSIANSIAAQETGATWIDGCTCGLGAGAGNAPTEVLTAVFEKLGVDVNAETFPMLDVAEDVVRPIMDRPQVVDRASLLLGYAGVYSSFLLHAEQAAERFGVSTKDILVEVGKRKAVGGQEDLIIEIAAELGKVPA
ncbi:MAG TPA: 4-hydroxy-2-oxovalerate aldolase [Solirubrobacterales bacterium]|nr:4-hydroxy-2-oxovalerate aldolase [Solirubrobacterales bacterium]